MSRALAARGHEVRVCCYGHGWGQADPRLHLHRAWAPPGYTRMRAGPDWVKPLLNAALVRQVNKAARGADLLHAHNYEAPLACLPARARHGLPLVYCAHNQLAEELPTYFAGAAQRRLAQISGRALDLSVPRLADLAQAIHPRAVPALRALGCQRVACVMPGVDPAELPETAPAALPPGPWVVYAGNPDRYQDLEVLFAAMHMLPEARLLLVSAADMGEWAAQLPPGTLRVQTDDFAVVRAHLAAADLGAIPRVQCSGFPIKLLNQLGMGLPTVMSTSAAVELPGVVTAPDRDPAAWAATLRALLAAPGRRAALGRAARRAVLGQCTWEARAAELEAHYGALLLARRP
jgi:glycosyltransferase involved in cell wall biosynthesis